MQDYDITESLISKLDDRECARIFHAFRWPDGIRCIKCNKPQHKIYTTGTSFRYHCAGCRIWFNDFTGTVIENTRLNLSRWFRAIHYFLNLDLTCAEVGQRLDINRNTAQYLRQKILKDQLWCKLLLQKISGQANRPMVHLMQLREVQEYLGLSQQTLYRLIKQGALSASKVGGQWRFKPEDVQKYITHKLNRYGTDAITETILFRPEVLNKYRKDKTKYYLQEEAYQGWVGSKEDYNFMQNALNVLGQGAKDAAALGQIAFYDIHYRKVVISGGPALAISEKDYAGLPPALFINFSKISSEAVENYYIIRAIQHITRPGGVMCWATLWYRHEYLKHFVIILSII
ncbi:MAG: helix-turn-helix domain-containing protein [Planctomycetes bacterium]|nr:helix-turn-helix domain-containing protein [Planctomycetota bacterium]